MRATVEVAHEALIQRWPTLRAWVGANRENLRARAAILGAKREWEEKGQDEKFLLDPGVQLERGRALLENPGDVPVDDISDYVRRSIDKDQRRLAAEREAALADQKRIAEARKRTAQVAIVGLAAALLVAGLAVWQFLQATDAKKDALTQRDAAVQAQEAANKAEKDVVTASEDKTARIWDAASGKAIGEPLEGHDSAVWSAAFSPDGKRIVTASDDKTARIWDAASGKAIGELKGHTGEVNGAAFSPDGKRIVSASDDGTARLWDILDTQALVSHAKADIPRCLTAAQRKASFLRSEPPYWCIEMEKRPYNTSEWKQWLSDTRAGKNPPLPAAP